MADVAPSEKLLGIRTHTLVYSYIKGERYSDGHPALRKKQVGLEHLSDIIGTSHNLTSVYAAILIRYNDAEALYTQMLSKQGGAGIGALRRA
jgi:hypothetical protein